MIPTSQLRRALRALQLQAAKHPRIGHLCADAPLWKTLLQLKATGRVSLRTLSGSLYCAIVLEEEGEPLASAPWTSSEALLKEILEQGRHDRLRFDKTYGLFYTEDEA